MAGVEEHQRTVIEETRENKDLDFGKGQGDTGKDYEPVKFG